MTLRSFAPIGLVALLACPLAAQTSADRQALRSLADADLSLGALTSMAEVTSDSRTRSAAASISNGSRAGSTASPW